VFSGHEISMGRCGLLQMRQGNVSKRASAHAQAQAQALEWRWVQEQARKHTHPRCAKHKSTLRGLRESGSGFRGGSMGSMALRASEVPWIPACILKRFRASHMASINKVKLIKIKGSRKQHLNMFVFLMHPRRPRRPRRPRKGPKLSSSSSWS